MGLHHNCKHSDVLPSEDLTSYCFTGKPAQCKFCAYMAKNKNLQAFHMFADHPDEVDELLEERNSGKLCGNRGVYFTENVMG